MKEKINIVWLKRDLRISDHEAFQKAIESASPFLAVFCFEPSLIKDPHYTIRHWQFIHHSILEMNKTLAEKFKLPPIHCYYGEFIDFVKNVEEKFKIEKVFSHMEIGLTSTFRRDIEVKEFLQNENIEWIEYKQNAVLRGLKNRKRWRDFYKKFTLRGILHPEWKNAQIKHLSELNNLQQSAFYQELKVSPYNFQQAGEDAAHFELKDFFQNRHQKYLQHISKPFLAVKNCSRLSPHLAWGNITSKQIYYFAAQYFEQNKVNKRQANAFLDRVKWRCHFMQKFESETIIENQCFNQAFEKLDRKRNKEIFKLWSEGKTGFPLVDACMISLRETGYLNFRMRAMVSSFYINILWQDWKWAALHLARVFLDFEPGIHYSQIHMQAGNTGIHTLRIYNPYKQSYENDSDAKFITKWLPQLSKLPTDLIHEPHKISAMEEMMYDFKLGEDYPKPIVNFEFQLREAKRKIAEIIHSNECKKEALRIMNRHVNPK